MTTTCRIHVQNYATYNAGNLDGRWYDMDDYDDLEALEAAVKANNRPNAEEFFIADSEGYPAGLITEYTHYRQAFELAEELEGVADHLVLEALYDAFGVGYFDTLADAIEALERHQGTAEDEKSFAEEYAALSGFDQGTFPEGSPAKYIDWQWYWDGQLRFSFVTGNDSEGNLHFFTND